MRTAVGKVDSATQQPEFLLRFLQFPACSVKFIFQRIYYVLNQYPGGALRVSYPDAFGGGTRALCLCLRLCRLGIGFPQGGSQSHQGYNEGHHAAAEYPVQYLAQLHTIRILVTLSYWPESSPSCFPLPASTPSVTGLNLALAPRVSATTNSSPKAILVSAFIRSLKK